MDERTGVNYYYTLDFSLRGIKKRVDRRPWSWGRGPWVGKTGHDNARGGTQELNKWTRVRKIRKRKWKGRKMDLGPSAQLLEIGSLWLLFLQSYSSKCLLDTLSVSTNYSTNLCSLWHLEGPLNANHLYKYCKLQAKGICTRKDSKFIPIC